VSGNMRMLCFVPLKQCTKVCISDIDNVHL
jgi:hypothetical protein